MSRVLDVLCFSLSQDLLETRRLVLLTRHRVTAVGSVAALRALPCSSNFQLLIMCHTLSGANRDMCMRFARQCWPNIKVLGILSPFSTLPKVDFDAVIEGLQGPGAMLDTIAHLLPESLQGSTKDQV